MSMAGLIFSCDRSTLGFVTIEVEEDNSFSPHSTGQLKTKTVYIVYAEDQPPDISFVEELSNFLQTHGQCHVVYPSAESIQSEDPVLSSRSAIDCADHILFLDSVAAEKFLASFNIKQVFVTRSLSPGNQFFKLALDHLYIFPQALDKVIMLSYRDKCGSLQYIKAPVNLRLPEDFRALLMRIHNLTEEDAEFYSHSLPLCSDNFESTTQGSRLCSALQAVKEYEHKNPEWFQTKIGEPRPILQTHISQGSEDTGISISSVPEDDFGDKRETDLFQPDQPMVTVGYQGIPRGSGDSETDSLVTVGVNFLNGPGHRQGMQGSEETQSSFMRSLVHPSAIEHSSVDFCLGIENINSEVDT
ncbi:hypothetical protein PoB_001529300 [Plakobranchus ocellatus]|uniref:SEFIR domain-containing protein n=1 Tax=Plakobranchus ocellatus TaxID=259542 RepID=A0AAV3Z1Z3_9GAST|nr:hypothetical protein PoB_001529300 [Plakobranchus ocellatus]